SDTGAMGARNWSDSRKRPGDAVARLLAISVQQGGKVTDTVDIRNPIEIEMTYEVVKDDAQILSAFSFFDELGIHLFVLADMNEQRWAQPIPQGIYKSHCTVPGNLFS